MKPSARLRNHRPRNRIVVCNKRSCPAGNHAGTQRYQKRRQIHNTHHNAIGKTENSRRKKRYQHPHDHRRLKKLNDSAADRRVCNQSGTDGKINTACDQRKTHTECHQHIETRIIRHGNQRCIPCKLRIQGTESHIQQKSV